MNTEMADKGAGSSHLIYHDLFLDL